MNATRTISTVFDKIKIDLFVCSIWSLSRSVNNLTRRYQYCYICLNKIKPRIVKIKVKESIVEGFKISKNLMILYFSGQKFRGFSEGESDFVTSVWEIRFCYFCLKNWKKNVIKVSVAKQGWKVFKTSVTNPGMEATFGMRNISMTRPRKKIAIKKKLWFIGYFNV